MKIVIFNKILLVIIFTILIILINKKNKEKFIINDNKWLNYRLGDVILGWEKLYIKNKNSGLSYIDNIKYRYKDSICDHYINDTKNIKNNEKNGNIKILNKIINNKKKNITSLPKDNDIILHLRIGDAIEDYLNDKFIYNTSNRFKSFITQGTLSPPIFKT